MFFLGSCSFSFPAMKQAMEKKIIKHSATQRVYFPGANKLVKRCGGIWQRWSGVTICSPVGHWDGPGAGVCGSEGLQSPWCGTVGWEPWRVSPSSCAQRPGCPRLPWKWRLGSGRYPIFIVLLHEIEVVFPSRACPAEKLGGMDLVHPGVGVVDPLPCQSPEGRAVSPFLFAELFWLC